MESAANASGIADATRRRSSCVRRAARRRRYPMTAAAPAATPRTEPTAIDPVIPPINTAKISAPTSKSRAETRGAETPSNDAVPSRTSMTRASSCVRRSSSRQVLTAAASRTMTGTDAPARQSRTTMAPRTPLIRTPPLSSPPIQASSPFREKQPVRAKTPPAAAPAIIMGT